jgi:hypothetical protein
MSRLGTLFVGTLFLVVLPYQASAVTEREVREAWAATKESAELVGTAIGMIDRCRIDGADPKLDIEYERLLRSLWKPEMAERALWTYLIAFTRAKQGRCHDADWGRSQTMFNVGMGRFHDARALLSR